MGKTTTTMAVDMIACAGHGICAELLPEWIRLDDWGYPIIRREAIPAELLTQARKLRADGADMSARRGTVETLGDAFGDSFQLAGALRL